VPIFLLDDTQVIVKITPASTAGGVIITARTEVRSAAAWWAACCASTCWCSARSEGLGVPELRNSQGARWH
jgi:hypothetical protein